MTGDTTSDATQIQRIIKDDYEQLYANEYIYSYIYINIYIK